MNRALYDAQFRQFSEQCREAGIEPPTVKDQIAVLNEDTQGTSPHLDFDYLLHGAWIARQLAKAKPKGHVDIGSYCYFAVMISAFIPGFEFYDYRPLGAEISGLSCGRADLMKLPFPENSIASLSSLHVIEHIGLGRYGDNLEPFGDVRAARELVRVLAPGGRLYIVEPMNETPRINFNAHRIYSHGQIKALFYGLRWQEWCMIVGQQFLESGFGLPTADYTGCFVFTK